MNCPHDCNNHGECSETGCLCDVGWFDPGCTSSLLLHYFRGFSIWQYTFTVLYVILGLYSFLIFYNAITELKTMSYLKGFRLIWNCSKSPKFLSLIIIFIICVLRVIWLTVDPFIMLNRLHRSLERVLYEIVFSFLYTLFSIILFVWYIIFGELSYNISCGKGSNGNALNKYKKNRYCSIFQYTVKFRVLIIFTIQCYSSIMKGERLGANVVISNNALYIILYAFFLFFIFEFSVHGFEVYKILKEIEKKNAENFDSKKDRKKEDYYDHIIENNNSLPDNNSNRDDLRPVNLHISLQRDSSDLKGSNKSALSSPGKELENSKILTIFKRNPRKSQTKKSPARKSSFSPKKNPGKNGNSFQFSDKDSLDQSKIPQELKASQILMTSTKKLISRKIKDINPYSKKLHKSTDENTFKSNFILSPQPVISQEDIEMQKKETLEKFVNFKYSKDCSFIIDNPEDTKLQDCWRILPHERKFLNNKEKENLENELTKNVLLASQRRQEYRKYPNLQTFDGKTKKPENDHDQKYFEFDLKKTTITHDKKVSKRILSITLLGLILEIAFALLSLVEYYSTFMDSPESLLSVLYSSSVLEYLCCILVIFLFTHEKSKEINNLRWISKVGNRNNQINKMFIFKLPSGLLKLPQYTELENRINFLSKNEPGL